MSQEGRGNEETESIETGKLSQEGRETESTETGKVSQEGRGNEETESTETRNTA